MPAVKSPRAATIIDVLRILNFPLLAAKVRSASRG